MKNFDQFIYLFILVQTLFVAIHDVKYKKISNQWTILNCLLFTGFLLMFPDRYELSLNTFFYSFTFLFVGLIGFAMRIMGAGDSKYLFSLFLLTPALWHDQVFTLLLNSTMIIGGFSMLTSISQNHEKIVIYARSGYARGIKECLGNKFPYAPVIFMSWAWLGYAKFFL